MKKIAVLPALLTLGNGICGFVAITYASKIGMTGQLAAVDEQHFVWAGWFIMFGMLFDMLDGYVARLSRTASAFGGELDSLCDAVSFGVAPAFLVLKLGPGWENPFLHQLLAGIAALYLSCTVLRLARFNVDNTPDPSGHKRFRGLPSPGAAGCIAALAILHGAFASKLAPFLNDNDMDHAQAVTVRVVEIVSPIGALVVALLMVSNVPYPHVTGKVFAGKKHIGHIIQLLLAVFIISMVRELAPVLIFWIYALAFPLRALWVRGLRHERAGPSAPPELHEPTQR